VINRTSRDKGFRGNYDIIWLILGLVRVSNTFGRPGLKRLPFNADIYNII
jgi:hypothetical protein